MASLNMGRSFPLDEETINRMVEDNRIGNYAYGYINNEGTFIVKYVGRSDNNLKERVKHGIADRAADSDVRYERFKFSYASSVNEAYEKECINYHDFGGPKGLLVNKIHPAKPEDSSTCPVCGE